MPTTPLNTEALTSQQPRGMFARFRTAWRGFDRYLATRWPALHVTQTHRVVGVMLLVNVFLVALSFAVSRRTDSVPNVATWLGVLLLVAICGTLGWLIYRAVQYRLLPVTKGMGRVGWIWLDFISLLAINGSVLLPPLILESRIRGLKTLESLERDRKRISAESEEISSWRSRDLFINAWVQGTDGGTPSSLVRSEKVWKLKSNQIIDTLLVYVPESILKGPEPNSMYASGFDVAEGNMKAIRRAHSFFLKEMDDVGFLFWLGFIEASVLVVASLPAVKGKGLLGALAVLVIGGIFMGIVAFVSDGSNFALWITFGSIIAVAFLISAWGLLRERENLVTCTAFSTCLLILPYLGWILYLWADTFARSDRGLFGVCGFVAVAVMILLIPAFQYCINRLHAAPN